MTLSSIKVGDIVHVDKKGRRFYAEVTGKVDELFQPLTGESFGKGLGIQPLCRETYRTATAREVIGHYRKAAGSA